MCVFAKKTSKTYQQADAKQRKKYNFGLTGMVQIHKALFKISLIFYQSLTNQKKFPAKNIMAFGGTFFYFILRAVLTKSKLPETCEIRKVLSKAAIL